MNRSIFCIALFFSLTAHSEVVEPYADTLDSDYEEIFVIEDYEEREVHGFKVYVHTEALEDQEEKIEAVYDFVESAIKYMRHRFFVQAFDKLAVKTKIVISDHCAGEEQGTQNCCPVCYHPDFAGWSDFRRGAVGIFSLDIALRHPISNPGLVKHEVAHAYHDMFLPDGFENQTIIDYYQRAVNSGKYEEVNSIFTSFKSNRKKVIPYFMTNEKEYFAVLSEALFLRSDTEPFTFFDVFDDKTLTDRCEDDMSISVYCENDPDYRFNPVYNSWWRYSGPHNGVFWYYQTLVAEDDENNLAQPSVPELPTWLNLDHHFEN